MKSHKDLWQMAVWIVGLTLTVLLLAAACSGQNLVQYQGYTYLTSGPYLVHAGPNHCDMCRWAAYFNRLVDQRASAERLAAARRAAETAGTPREAIPEIIPLLALDSTSELVDVGCGDGRIVNAAAALAKCRATGIEIDGELANKAASDARKLGLPVQIIHADALQLGDFAAGKTVYVYLFPEMLAKLRPQLRQANRVVSFMHDPGLDGAVRYALTVGARSYSVFVWQQPRMKLPLSVPPLKT